MKIKIYIIDPKYDLCGIWTQKINVQCDGGYQLAISALLEKA